MERLTVIEGILAAENLASKAAVGKVNGEVEEEKKEEIKGKKKDSAGARPALNEKKGREHNKSRGKGAHVT
jgi:hypothetical protein